MGPDYSATNGENSTNSKHRKHLLVHKHKTQNNYILDLKNKTHNKHILDHKSQTHQTPIFFIDTQVWKCELEVKI